MMLSQTKITCAIVERFSGKLLDHTEVDTAIAGGGPACLVAAYYLAKAWQKVAIFERKLSIGGGM